MAVLVIYGAGLYLLGSTNFLQKLLHLQDFIKVKGTSAKSDLNKPIESTVPSADSQSNLINSSYIKRCSNTKIGFEITYPKDWFTTYNTEDQRCTFIAPYSFTVPQDTANFTVPIKVEIYKPGEWAGIGKFYENPNDFQNIISIQNMEINGKSVAKIKAVTTGVGLQPKGLAKISFLYPDSKLPMIVIYQQQDTQENTSQMEDVLEEIVRSINSF